MTLAVVTSSLTQPEMSNTSHPPMNVNSRSYMISIT